MSPVAACVSWGVPGEGSYFPVRRQVDFLKASEPDHQVRLLLAEERHRGEKAEHRQGEEKAPSMPGESRNPVWLWSEGGIGAW